MTSDPLQRRRGADTLAAMANPDSSRTALRRHAVQVAEAVWEIAPSAKPGMRVPARIYATVPLLAQMDDGVFDQVTNVAMLPGIVKYACCMPDGHWGYGFPIGGVAAMDPDHGVISPGGIGFDINCGMRLVRTNLTFDDIRNRIPALIDALYKRVPAGVGARGLLKLNDDDFRAVAERGARWCVEHGYGWPEDLDHTEEGGAIAGADADRVSPRALERGRQQVGTLGSGNHYLEIQVVRPENVFDAPAAEAMGINIPHQVVLMFHCGSRGFGHQIASDYIQLFLPLMQRKFHIELPDRDLACAPFASPEGQAYFAAMKCAMNMSFANRQVILHRIREVFADVLQRDPRDLGLQTVYDVSHNTAKLEEHDVNGKRRRLLVHRKGATRAFAPGMPDVPPAFRELGQPVIIGGSMETGSYLLRGVPSGRETFFTTAHGSGRAMSRTQAKKQFRGKQLEHDLAQRGIYVRSVSYAGLAEEAGAAYKDIDAVVAATAAAGLSRPVVRFVPVGNVKG
ncbi:MAG TPA: RtcB family protein [Candidatus Acidoferrales bacterium]|nr:RtcB family protein [Candidatus Acidoferrales bacterium]